MFTLPIKRKISLIFFLIISFSLIGCFSIQNPRIIFEEEEVTIYVGETKEIIVSVLPLSYEYQLTWESSDEKTVSVNEEGIISALQVGTTTITVLLSDAVFNQIVVNVIWNEQIIPTIKIDTTNVPITSKDNYIQGMMVVKDLERDKIYLEDSPINIRGRGNSTWGMPKKPYRIKFSERTSLLGMKAAKDYVLLAEYSDKSLMRNYLAHKFASSLEYLEYSLETRFVEVELNGVYQGLYLLTEQVEVDKNRLSLTQTPDIEGSFLIELDQRLYEIPHGVLGEDWFIVANKAYGIKYPKTDASTFSNLHFNYIKDYITQVDQAITTKKYHDIIDINNFIDYFIVLELFKNVDVGFSSVYIYKDVNGLVKMGPVWDFDLAAGNADYINYGPSGWYGLRSDKNRWFHYLMNDPDFYIAYKERYNDLYKNQIPALIEEIYPTLNLISQAATRNFEAWPILNHYVWPNPIEMVNAKTHQAQVDYLYNYLCQRSKWMYDELNKK